MEIKANLDVDIKFNYSNIEQLDSDIEINSQNNVKVHTKNQDRHMDTCTANRWEPLDSSNSFYKHTRQFQ